MFRRCMVLVSVSMVVAWAGSARAADQVLLGESLADDPIAGGRAAVLTGDAGRFVHAPGKLTAAVDSALDTALLRWPLPQVLTQATGFRATLDFTIDGISRPNSWSQIAFGFFNSVTTGTNRTGGPGFAEPTSYDVLSVDYFPSYSLNPTAFTSGAGDSAWNHFHSPFYEESEILNAGEPGALSVGQRYSVELRYDPATQVLTVRMPGLPVNAVGSVGFGNGRTVLPGGIDGRTDTIELSLAGSPDLAFALDSFGILLWKDYATLDWLGYDGTLAASVSLHSFEVALTPEPATLGVLALGGLLLLRRRG